MTGQAEPARFKALSPVKRLYAAAAGPLRARLTAGRNRNRQRRGNYAEI